MDLVENNQGDLSRRDKSATKEFTGHRIIKNHFFYLLPLTTIKKPNKSTRKYPYNNYKAWNGDAKTKNDYINPWMQ